MAALFYAGLCTLILSACASSTGAQEPAHAPSAAASGGAMTSSPTVTGGSHEAAAPTLVIISPGAGDTVTQPFLVHYEVSDVPADAARGLQVRVTLANDPSYRVDYPVSAGSGAIQVPEDKLLSGVRTLTFSLLRADGTAWPGAHTAVTVDRLTIAGGR